MGTSLEIDPAIAQLLVGLRQVMSEINIPVKCWLDDIRSGPTHHLICAVLARNDSGRRLRRSIRVRRVLLDLIDTIDEENLTLLALAFWRIREPAATTSLIRRFRLATRSASRMALSLALGHQGGRDAIGVLEEALTSTAARQPSETDFLTTALRNARSTEGRNR